LNFNRVSVSKSTTDEQNRDADALGFMAVEI